MSDNKELAKLKNRLQGKALIVGIGNRLRGDDGVGPEIINRLSSPLPHLLLFDVGETPENYLGKIVLLLIQLDHVWFQWKELVVFIINIIENNIYSIA